MSSTTIAHGATLHGFTVLRVEPIPELRCEARILSHDRTGARLIHLANEDPNNLFCCGFRTPVYNNTGVPHILEHSVLGGSTKFPFKDPFQQLLKSSLQTFLNALTYPDKTLYPVGSQVERDFYNLVDVYCDAVFHPLLTERTFYQEGWHFDVPDPAKAVDIKGIVYNEMKGVFSDFTSHVARRTLSGLYPDTTYFHESGGEPEHIPELTYDAFRDFHARYYHPSNAFIFLYGSQDAARTLQFLEDKYLGEYERLEIDSRVPVQPLWDAPRRMEIDAPAPQEDAGTASVDVCWVFGDSTDPVRSLAGRVLSRYLIGTESSPLRRALIDSELGEDLDVLCGFDDEMVQSMFAAGLRKAKPDAADAVERLVLDTLREQVEGAMNEELLEGALRQTEFGLREIADAGRWPYSLKLADRCYRSWLYDGDPVAHLAFEGTLEVIRASEGSAARFFVKLIRDALLDNPHRLVAVIKASPEMGAKLEQQTAEQARRLSADFTDDDIARYHTLTEELVEEQKRQPAAEELATLPRVAREDLPLRNQETPVETGTVAGARLLAHPLFCGGISYLDLGFDCSHIDPELVSYLPLYSELATRCGAAGHDYEQMATRISLSTGGVSSSIMADTDMTDPSRPLFKVFFHAKCLTDRFGEMSAILQDLLTAPHLTDTKLIGDVVLEMRNDHNASILGGGHTYAALHASSRLDPVRLLNEQLDGIDQLRFLDRLVKEDSPAAVAERLTALHEATVSRAGALVSMTADRPDAHFVDCESLLQALPAECAGGRDARPLKPAAGPARTGVEINASVNYVSRAWLLPEQSAADMGTIALLCLNLSRGFLWDHVRVEGGAYGARASLNSTYPVFTCASYRDPNLARTVTTFADALAFAAREIDDESVAESIVGTIGEKDRPRTPHARGFSETGALLTGRSVEYRQQTRDAILNATADTVRTKAAQIVESQSTSLSVLGSAGAFERAAGEGVQLSVEPLLG
jgi:Zn-dependent M16 (insulinase) family peptidase